MRSVSITVSPLLTFTDTYAISFQSSLFITAALYLICYLTITSCGKGLGEVLVCVCKWNTCIFLCTCLWGVCVCVCWCCRGFVVLCRRVFPECGGSERHFGYILIEHTGPFSRSCGYTTHTHARMLSCRSLLYKETNRLIHSAERLNVIKIYRSWFFSGVTDQHSSIFGSRLKGWSEEHRSGSATHSGETEIVQIGFQKGLHDYGKKDWCCHLFCCVLE